MPGSILRRPSALSYRITNNAGTPQPHQRPSKRETLTRYIGKLCGEAPSEWFLGVPCVMLYVAYQLGNVGRSYGAGMSFYEDVLMNSLNQAGKIKGVKNDVINFTMQELDRVQNDREYRGRNTTANPSPTKKLQHNRHIQEKQIRKKTTCQHLTETP